MNFLATFLAALVPKILDWLMARNAKMNARKKNDRAINEQRDRLKKAIDAAYDGEPVTKEEKDEVIDAAKDLIRNY
jgi:hypothetical protein